VAMVNRCNAPVLHFLVSLSRRLVWLQASEEGKETMLSQFRT